MKFMMNERAEELWFLICNNLKRFCEFHPHRKFSRMIDAVLFIMMELEGSRIFGATNNLRCFIKISTELSESELSNSMMTGAT